MSLYAMLNNQAVNTITEPDPEVFRGESLTCRECGGRMILVSGKLNVPHFRHEVLTPTCVHENESSLHLELKKKIYDAFISFNPVVKADFEVSVQDGSKRYVIDILVGKIAFEIQVSPCTIEYVTEKIEAFEKLGLYPVWIFPTEQKYTLKEPVGRINDVVKNLFYNRDFYYQKNMSLEPFAFFYRGDELILPSLARVTQDNRFSPTGYVNNYYFGDRTMKFNWPEFVEHLLFFSELRGNKYPGWLLSGKYSSAL